MFYDWLTSYWPQMIQPFSLQKEIFNLPFLFLFLQPLRLLGPYGSVICIQIFSIFIIISIGKRLGLSPLRIALVLLSPPVLWNIFVGQIDGLMMLAYILPAGWSVPVTIMKPQTTFGAAWREFRINPLRTVAISAILIFVAFLIWRWPFSIDPGSPLNLADPWNWSFWPWGLLLLPLLFIKDKRGGMFVSPFLFPYAALQSLIGPILVVATMPGGVFFPIWLLTWIRWSQIYLTP